MGCARWPCEQQFRGPLRVDAENVYWTVDNGGLARVAKVGGPPVTFATAASYAESFTIDATDGYWITDQANGELVLKVPLVGGAVTTIASIADSSAIFGILVDTNSVYWIGGNTPDRITKAPLDGDTTVTLAANVGDASTLVLGASGLYWANEEGLFSLYAAGGPPVRRRGGS